MTDTFALAARFRRWKRRLPLSSEDKAAVVNLTRVRKQYQRDALSRSRREPTNVCTVLLQGFALRQKILSDGSRQIISFHIAGELLELQNCLLEVADHNVQALTRAFVAIVPKELLLQVISARPAGAAGDMAAPGSRRLQRTNLHHSV